ncbi:hypothetical protein [Rubritalea profundi]|uniref:Uncharacterized protein n=1 Tax=Rubritalea profundi TaxID=1658618 RepID=A0A2S7TZM8_9BACT|nr:hypothetical protein [Rubritalea profundi]PQJ27532.1 hypothetical protein BSZ32_02825 [Rubritalea profundi]
MTPTTISESAQAQLDAVQANPADWAGRKEAAHKLYEEGYYLEAANTVWNAPEMPSTDIDVAFAVKIVSRARPNRSIRLVYEVLRRNSGKAEQNMALARSFSLIGLPMLASRFYGAAIAADTSQFDIGFEQQSLWFDDSGSLLEAWGDSSSDIKPPFSKPVEAFLGNAINFAELTRDLPQEVSPVTGPISNRVAKPSGLNEPPVLRIAKPARPAVAPAQQRQKPSAPIVTPVSSTRKLTSLVSPPSTSTHNTMVPAKNTPKPMLPPLQADE